jgi:hypothetical protein
LACRGTFRAGKLLVQPAKEPAATTKSLTIPHRTIQILKIWEDGFVAEATLYLYLYLYLGLVRGLRLRGWGFGVVQVW